MGDGGSNAGRLLVVDDNPMNRDMLSRRLEKRGYAVDSAEDGTQALAMIDGGAYDLVLLDVMMPGISGLDVLKRLRETRDPSALPVIMATAKDAPTDIVAALELGANDYVTKPLEFRVVLARVQVQLQLRDAHAQLARRNAFIRSVFGRYLTDDIAEAVLDTPAGLALGGERREITILMADLRGFSTLAADRDPADVMVIVNHFLSTMTDVILAHGGTIDEFIGDAVLALFGAPRPMDGHARRAVECAQAMQQAMATVNALNRAAGLPDVATGIGVNTGEVIVGNIGSERRAKYGVVGEQVNLASRIEALTAGGQVLVSARTRELCGPGLAVRESLTVRPKGHSHDVELFDVAL